MNRTIYSLKEKLINKEISSEELVKSYLSVIEEISSFTHIDRVNSINYGKECDRKINAGEKLGLLEGIPICVKDNIAVKDMKMTCGLDILENFIAPYDADVVKRLKAEGAIIIGKANSETILKTPLYITSFTKRLQKQDIEYSSGIQFSPSYSLVSRYGLASHSSTLEGIGTLTRDVKDLGLVLNILSGKDIYTKIFNENIRQEIKNIKIGLPKECFDIEENNGIREKVLEKIKTLEKLGAKVEKISIPFIEYSYSVYDIISSAEASSNLARIDGIRYGTRVEKYDSIDELITKNRGEGLDKEAKRKTLLGTYFLDSHNYENYYKKAIKIRQIINREVDNTFKRIDILVSPITTPNLSGTPSISIPCESEDGEYTMQIIANKGRDELIMKVAYILEGID